MFVGLFLAIFSQREYTASTTIVPSLKGKSSVGNIGGLAAMAGINLDGSDNESTISPSLYPQIIYSISFQKELLLTPLTFEGQDSSITYKDYYTNYYSPGLIEILKKYTIGLPGLILKKIKKKESNFISLNELEESNFHEITDEESVLIKRLNKQLSLNINKKDGYVTISFSMPEAMLSAQMTQKAQKLLQQYIINFKLQKSLDQLEFIKGRYNEKKKEFNNAQEKLASFQDGNQSINSALSKMNLMRLQTDYDIAFNVYSELAKQMETQQIQVKKDTPIFTVLKEVVVPIEKSKPNRPLILGIWTLLGNVIGVGIVFGKPFLKKVKQRL
jgi:uncharacterized protein involved in exopolysaccharide biosynthesis